MMKANRNKLELAMAKACMSTAELQKAAEMPRPTLNNVISGKSAKPATIGRIARALGVKGVDDMSVEEYRKAAVDAVQKLSVDVGIPTKLEALKEEDLQFLAESAHADACAPGNPKDASVEDLKELFRKLM